MTYTVGEMAKRLGISASALRYYDREGLLPFVERSEGGIRLFREGDIEWLRMILCLKRTGMRLEDIRSFVTMAMAGDRTVDARLALIVKQKETVIAEIAKLREVLDILEYKEWYYETARAAGGTQIPRDMPAEKLPPRLRGAREKLRGEGESQPCKKA